MLTLSNSNFTTSSFILNKISFKDALMENGAIKVVRSKLNAAYLTKYSERDPPRIRPTKLQKPKRHNKIVVSLAPTDIPT